MKKFTQHQDIKYSKYLSCDCGFADYSRKHSYKIIGYCETNYGFMAVFECPKCLQKYKHHIGNQGKFNFEIFQKKLKEKIKENEKTY